MPAFYHGLTKKLIVAFGSMFMDIHVLRRKGDTITGKVTQDIHVPIAYGPRDSWFMALETNPARQKETKVTLPRMSYELTGLSYDSQRKLTRSSTIKCTDTTTGETAYVATPAPWNYEFSLYVTANNSEDIYQIVEQILPLFNPDWTIHLRQIPKLGIITDVPFSLTSVSMEDNFDQGYEQRLVTWTLTFIAKANLYGEVRENAGIMDVEMNMDEGGATETYTLKSENGELVEEWNLKTGDIKLIAKESAPIRFSPTIEIQENGETITKN